MINNPFPKDNEMPVPIYSYPIIGTIKLALPDTPSDMSFWSVIRSRISHRSFRQLSIHELGQVLWFSAKVKVAYAQENGYILTHRPTPSAGARHPIDIIILSATLDRCKSLYYYNPFDHSLNELNLENSIINEFERHINSIIQIASGTVIWFVAHSDRTSAKYANSASLIWRDAGALIHQVQLVCSAFKINSCPIGSLGEPYITKLFGNTEDVFGTGGLIIG